jgi:hypothetical protein
MYGSVREAVESDDALVIDLLYGDHEGGQRTIVRFALTAWPLDEHKDDSSGRRVTAVRYWNVDRADPR